ncbi:hypothetical protein SS50377_21968 [Spironucleus salmonicida]|uniref:Transmembrane protein n=1 Tax=Spironucleus salmonicida TaxID=348837 RepID=V6LQQ5_9EUKA|nr:hypothetical protein SS50377_21968 [Spironucleus salmonicida]|eukprot:EST47007.1 Hypothetical protein SS50377_12962 [Spironucleus salmonicida]
MILLQIFAAKTNMICFSTVTQSKVSLKFVTESQTVTVVQNFIITIKGQPLIFVPTQEKLQFVAQFSMDQQQNIAEFFEATPTINIITTEEVQVQVYAKSLLHQFSDLEVLVTMFYTSETDNSIVIQFPIGVDIAKGEYVQLGSDFYNIPSTDPTSLTFTCPGSFAQTNPAHCYDRLKGLLKAQQIQIFTTEHRKFQSSNIYFLGNIIKFLDYMEQIDNKIKFTPLQIIMIVCICALLLMSLVLPIVCCKSNGRKSPINQPLASGFGPIREIKQNTYRRANVYQTREQYQPEFVFQPVKQGQHQYQQQIATTLQYTDV